MSSQQSPAFTHHITKPARMVGVGSPGSTGELLQCTHNTYSHMESGTYMGSLESKFKSRSTCKVAFSKQKYLTLALEEHQGILWEGVVAFISTLPPFQGQKHTMYHTTVLRSITYHLEALNRPCLSCGYMCKLRSSIPGMPQTSVAEQKKILTLISPNSDRQNVNLRSRNIAAEDK